MAAKYYFAPAFAAAVRRLKYFLVNSEETCRSLRPYCRQDAEIRLYRPEIRNIFGLAVADRAERSIDPPVVRAVAIGTIEPRKNIQAAANICAALQARIGRPTELHLIGRSGWGGDHLAVARRPGVIMHGPVADTEARRVIESADFLICTSHDEGLGLPLLEVQHGGLPVIAPERPIFREVLSDSGVYIDPSAPAAAADQIARVIASPDWRSRYVTLSTTNVCRWNSAAKQDRTDVIAFFRSLLVRCGDKIQK